MPFVSSTDNGRIQFTTDYPPVDPAPDVMPEREWDIPQWSQTLMRFTHRHKLPYFHFCFLSKRSGCGNQIIALYWNGHQYSVTWAHERT